MHTRPSSAARAHAPQHRPPPASNAAGLPAALPATTAGSGPPRTRPLHQRLATLGDDSAELTCSMHVARRWGGARETVGCSSFEAARELLRTGRADALLVPAAYPRLNTFIMDEALLASQVFIMPIPALVLATCTGPIAPRLQQLIHHAAVTPLLPELGLCWVQARQADSNAEACRLLLAAPQPSACITNALCATHFGLEVVRELRPNLAMPWICFVPHPPLGSRSSPGMAEARP